MATFLIALVVFGLLGWSLYGCFRKDKGGCHGCDGCSNHKNCRH